MAFTLDAFERTLAGAVAEGATPRFVVALSGGLDSTVALSALLKTSLSASIRAVHVDHGLHPDSAEWRRHCRDVCAALHVPFTDVAVSARPSRGQSPEEAARQARYRCLEHDLGEGETLVTGHHADDQLETVLLQLLRGAGPAGLAAMPMLADFGRGSLCRPLLGFRRAELAAWAESRRLTWLEDPSNRETGFDRNYLRHHVVPRLQDRWPAAALSAVRSARLCGEVAELLEALGDIDLEPLSVGGRLDVQGVRSLSPVRQRNLLRRWMSRSGLTTPDARRLDSILGNVLGARGDRCPEVRWQGGAVRRYRGKLYALDATSLQTLDQPDLDEHWDPARVLDLGPGRGRLRLAPADGPGLDASWLAREPLTVRSRRGGERMTLPGRKGSRSVKKLLQEAGVPPWWRPHVPLIWQGGRLLAVADLWYSAEASSGGATGRRIVWEKGPDIS